MNTIGQQQGTKGAAPVIVVTGQNLHGVPGAKPANMGGQMSGQQIIHDGATLIIGQPDGANAYNANANIPGPSIIVTGNNDQNMQSEKGSLLDQEVSFLSRENAELKKALAEAQAKLRGQGDNDENKITDISTFHSTEKMDFERKNIFHYFVASSQYYKMRKPRSGRMNTTGPGAAGTGGLGNFFGGLFPQDDQADDHNLTIKYIENDQLKRKFENLKKVMKDNNDQYEEILLFHGTAEENVDSIFNNNFDIDHHPLNRIKV